ncbi:MAG: hypothetical protein WBA91_05200 [Paracoccaceae bacterium]
MRAPLHLWIIGGLALFFSLISLGDFLAIQLRFQPYLAQMNADEQSFFASFPPWVQLCWAVAVCATLLGAVMLLLRHRLATGFFALALLAMIATACHNFFLAQPRFDQVAGPEVIWFSLFVLVIGAAEWLYARRLRKVGLIR